MTTKNTFQITAWKWTKKTWLPNNCPDNRMKMNKINITIKLNYYSDHRIKFTTKKWLPNYSSDNRIQINKINMTTILFFIVRSVCQRLGKFLCTVDMWHYGYETIPLCDKV